MARFLPRLLMGALTAVAAVRAIGRVGLRDRDPRRRAKKKSVVIRTAVFTAGAVFLLTTALGLIVMASGVYQIAADEPHREPVRWLLRTGMKRSVGFNSRGIQPPDAQKLDAALAARGVVPYVRHCEVCHGGPGVAPAQEGRGMNPTPPPLMTAQRLWDDSELYWILTRGLKMAGMPAFGVQLNVAERWALVAFMRHMPLLTPAEYQRMSAAAAVTQAGEPIATAQWEAAHDYGFSRLRNQADAARGRRAFREYGCWTCHDSPRTRTGGIVGPDVTGFAERQYIAGAVPSLPGNLAAWIMHPPEFKPGTAMPDLNVPEQAAMDIVAYLYAEGDQRRLEWAERVIRGGQQQRQANAARMD